MMPNALLNPKDKQRVAKAQKLLQRVGIDQTRQARRPTKLSGGKQQQVTIARALHH